MHAGDLPGQGFEISRGAHNAPGQTAGPKFLFKGQFCLLEGKARFLHTNRRKKDELARARLCRFDHEVVLRIMFHRPGIFRCACPRCHARYNGLHALSLQRACQIFFSRQVAYQGLCPALLYVRTRPQRAENMMPL